MAGAHSDGRKHGKYDQGSVAPDDIQQSDRGCTEGEAQECAPFLADEAGQETGRAQQCQSQRYVHNHSP